MIRATRVLLLEDILTDAERVRKTLLADQANYMLTVVRSVEDYCCALTDVSFDLILSAVTTPSFNSNHAFEILLQTRLTIPFIALINAPEEALAIDLINNGADDYIFKDRLGRLPIAIRQALEKFRVEKVAQTSLNDLVKSEKRYRSLIENSSDAVVILTSEGKPTYVSSSVSKILGYSSQEIMEMELLSIMHPDDLAATAHVLEKVLRNPGIPIKGHTGKMLHKDGSWRWIEAVVTNCLHDPAINGIVDNFRDISEKKAADLQLYESEQFNKSILSSLTSHIAVINKEGTVIAVNRAWDNFEKANKILSPGPGSKGSNYFEVCKKAILEGDTDAARALNGIHSVFRKEVLLFEMEYPCHSPTEKRWFILRVMHFGEDDTKVVISHQNITPLKATQEDLILSQSRLNQAQAIAKIGSWEADLATATLFWSDQTYRIYELNPKNFTPTYPRFIELIHPGDRNAVNNAIQRSFTEDTKHFIEHRIITACGNQKVLEQRWHIIKDNEGVAIRVSGTCQEITQRKETEELVRLSNEKNKFQADLLDTIGQAVIATDLKGSITFWNKAAERIYGWSAKEAASKNLMALVPDNQADEPRNVMGILERGKEWSGEITVQRKDGSYFPVWLTNSPIYDSMRQLSGIIGISSDITEKKALQQQVLKIYEEKNVILESIGDAFFAVDQNWVISYWNTMAEKVLGKTKYETQGKNLWEVFSDAIGSEFFHKYHHAFKTNEAVHFEDYYLTLRRWYEVSAYPSGNVLSVYFKDITERKLTQYALEESERNYGALFHLSPLPMWVFDLESLRFLDVNQAAQCSYGYSLSEFLNMTIHDIRPQEDTEKLNQALRTEATPGQKLISQGIFTHKKKNGELIQVDIQSNLIQYRGKAASIIIASDMTERFKYIHAVEDQNTKLREIAWIQSHVVRAPLARIMGIVPMIRDIDSYADERATMLEYLLIAANELDDAIKNISDKINNSQSKAS